MRYNNNNNNNPIIIVKENRPTSEHTRNEENTSFLCRKRCFLAPVEKAASNDHKLKTKKRSSIKI